MIYYWLERFSFCFYLQKVVKLINQCLILLLHPKIDTNELRGLKKAAVIRHTQECSCYEFVWYLDGFLFSKSLFLENKDAVGVQPREKQELDSFINHFRYSSPYPNRTIHYSIFVIFIDIWILVAVHFRIGLWKWMYMEFVWSWDLIKEY